MRAFTVLLLALSLSAPVQADLPFVNWENHPQRALDLSPDGRTLAVAHTADARVQLFDVGGEEPVPLGHVVVGLDPVAVRFRDAGELWVANHISDSVSVVDVAARRVRATLATADEPFDIAFAGGRAFVSCSQANRVLVFDPADLARAPLVVPIAAEDPRALAVSRDGRSVLVAIFESGNASTVLAGGLRNEVAVLPNVVSDPRGPYGGRNPPPNAGDGFDPPLDPTAPPPRVGLIVRKDAQGRWRDDNGADWTRFVSGDLAAASGRPVGWDLPDRDLAVIDVQSLAVRYVSGLLTTGMALAVNPVSGDVLLVGTEARNELRFEPKVNGIFVQVMAARVTAAGAVAERFDLNPQLDYRSPRVDAATRALAIGDPRAVVFAPDGARGWVAGLGSGNVVPIDARGHRVGAPIAVGDGPVGLAYDAARDRLYVWNHFEVSLSVVDPSAGVERARVRAFNPLPAAIRAGRPFLYDTVSTSGSGQVSCGSCHVDARMDRLAWDLGDPSKPPQRFDQNCGTVRIAACEDWHAMKGPMTTQTLQDIIGHEPLHWRGDRAGLEAFNPAFTGLMGREQALSAGQMQRFEDFLATIHFPPNPFRALDNGLPTALPLEGHTTSGRFAMAGLPLGTGDAVRGLALFRTGLLDSPFQCVSCHTLPTGMAVNGPLLLGVLNASTGGSVMARGMLGENHLGIVSVDGSTNVSIKTPQLRNLYEKVGMDVSRTANAAGFGFLHDGSVDSLSRFMSARTFEVRSDQDVADLVALMLAFSGSGFGDANPPLGGVAPLSRDTHAAVGAQHTASSAAPAPRRDTLLALARARAVDLVVHAGADGWHFDADTDRFRAGDGVETVSPDALLARATPATPQTWTAVPAGLGARLGIDRDGDGVGDAAERVQGSDPADADSRTLRPRAGLWYNPARSGHGFDLQFAGTAMAITWYTYDDAGRPIWYQAVGPAANPWRATLNRMRWDAGARTVTPEPVGEATLAFDDARRAEFAWTLGTRSGREPVQPLLESATPLPDRTGTWYDAQEPGWGLTLATEGALRGVVLYAYDGDGFPRWVLGSGENRETETLPMLAFRGACPDCAYVAPSTAPAGELGFAFAAARRGTLTARAVLEGAPWARGPVTIVPFSDPVLRPETR